MQKHLNLKEEEKCGFTITSKMKHVWQAEIDIYLEFAKICKKHNIDYIFFDGSLLGAIRHDGFIPWDDDIDVAMTRENFDKLKKYAKEFKKPLFFQTPVTDHVYRGHAQIRNSDTTAIVYGSYNKDANNGIFIDIFILDKVPENKFKKKLHKLHCKNIARMLRCNRLENNLSSKEKFFRAISKVFFKFISYEKYYEHYEKVCGKYNKSNSNSYNFVAHNYSDRIIRKEHLTDIKMHKFEYFEVPVPVKSEEFLTDYFGNWQKFVKGGTVHGVIFFDPEKPYTYYKDKSLDELKALEK